MPEKNRKMLGGLSGKLLDVEPEYRFVVYKTNRKMTWRSEREGLPNALGSHEYGKRPKRKKCQL
jgi:hypothetical protein